jgi:hypothetical protein
MKYIHKFSSSFAHRCVKSLDTDHDTLSGYASRALSLQHSTGNLKQIRLYIITQQISAVPQSLVEVHNVFRADL